MSKKFGKSCIGLFAIGLALLMGCTSSGSPSNPIEDGETLSSDSGDNDGQQNPGSSANTTPGKIVGYSSSTTPAAPPFDISTLPGTYTPGATLAYNVSGIASFGPFQKGATISVYGLDPSSMKNSPTAANATVSSDKGEFSAQGSITSNYANVVASGTYFNLTTQENATITLNAVMEMQGKTTVNVNVLTRLAYDRIVYLVAKESMSFAEAKSQAEREVLAALGLTYDETPFENISTNTEGQAGSNLIIATIMLSLDDSPTVSASNLASIAKDMAADGTWDDAALKTAIADTLTKRNMYSYVNVLKSVTGNSKITVKGLGPINFWAFQYGLGECTEENNGSTAINTNSLSSKYNTTFLCKDSIWQEVSAVAVYSAEVAAVLGECNSSNEGSTGTYNSDQVICKKNYWQKMTEADKTNAEIAKTEGPCTSSNNLKVVNVGSAYYQCIASMWKKLTKTPVDYSKGRAMNKKLGRGINFGNSWDAEGAGSNDGGWSNPIQDGWFAIVKNAGFNSIRLPVRWEQDANVNGGSISSARMNAVKADVDLAIKQGLTVIIDAHHHNTLNDAAANYSSNPSKYNSEKQKFLNMWSQIATTFSSYSSNVVLEILNEPHDIAMAQINDLMTSAYQVIRQKAPNSTIMFESAGYSKFSQIPNLNLPNDGNIIVSGHYYDPYTFTHQNHGYSYDANASFSATTIANDFASYMQSIATAFPDINGGCVPMNMGEFGVNSRSNSGISETKRAQWTDAVISAAEQQGMSWHYWAFAGAGGFEAYSGSWYSEIKTVFDKYLSKASAVK
jgi:aryl-phospho-beta-D-glucosidase BglC (GH1 family)